MADDNIKFPATQEQKNPRKNSIGIPDPPDNGKPMLPPTRRASVGSCHVGGNSRRNSSGNSGENNIPHYLRASTGSCHDFCKYGRKQTNEVKPWKIKPNRAVTSSPEKSGNTNVLVGDRKKTVTMKLNPSPEPFNVIKQNSTSVVPGERKKTTMLKLEPSPEPPQVIKKNTQTVVPRGRKKTTTLKLEPSPGRPKVIKQNNATLVPGERKKTAILKLDPSPEPSEALKQKYTTSIPGERKKTAMGELKSSSEPPQVIKREILLPSKKVEVSLKRNVSSPRKTSDKDLKTPSLKPKPATVMPSSSSDASVGSNGRRKSDGRTGKKTGPIKTAVKKFLVIPTLSLSPKSSVSKVLNLKAKKGWILKQVSPLKDKNRMPKVESVQPCNETVHKKTAHIIASDPGKSVFESLQTDGIVQSPSPLSPKSSPHANSQGSYSERDDLDYSVYTNSEEDDDYITENDEIVNPSGLETLQGDDKRASRKGKSGVSEEKDGAAVKLKFRRGSIVDVESESTGPRKLRFRRGRVLEGKDDQNGCKKRSYKKRGDDETKDSTRIEAEKVVLKHQDVQGKKDSQGLFNNVIEETASKLVETRKSKVKALVGAFETVISLQDS